MGDGEKDWDEYIDPILFAIRTSVQASTKHTPFFLMYGREAKLPLEVEKADVPVCSDQLPCIERRIEWLSNLKDSIFPAVKTNIEKAQKKQKEQYRKRRGQSKQHIKVGDTVMRLNMLKRTKKGHKAEDTWIGTYKVLEITEYGCCRLQCMLTNSTLKRKINIDQLKLYQQQEDSADQPAADHPELTHGLADSTSPNQTTDRCDSSNREQTADPEGSEFPDQATVSPGINIRPHAHLTDQDGVDNNQHDRGHCDQPTASTDNGFPDQPTSKLDVNSGPLEQPSSRANVGSGLPKQLTNNGGNEFPNCELADSEVNEDELSILEKELLNEDLFRLVQYESSYYCDTITESDKKLDVSIHCPYVRSR